MSDKTMWVIEGSAMGDMYLVLELNDEAVRWIKADWIAQSTMPQPPELIPRGSLPTLGELRTVLADLEPYRVVYHEGRESLDAEIVHRDGYGVGWSTTIWAKSARNDQQAPRSDDEHIRLTFHKGSPELAVHITERLTRQCGALLLVSANDGVPLIVFPGIEIDRVVQGWMTCWTESESSPNKA